MAKYKVEYDKESCIGTLACIQEAEDFFKEDDEDGKAKLEGAEYNEDTEKYELTIGEEDFEENRLAADACPVNAIEISEIEE